MSSSNGPFRAYKSALTAVSTRTGVPLPSLILSFGILHELTAIVPLVGVFYGARTFGIGERVVSAVIRTDDSTEDTLVGWVRQTCRTWVHDGENWAERVGRRYGVFGFEKKDSGAPQESSVASHTSGRIAGDVANAVVAYGATKALLPVRIGLSMYFSPAFSRGVIEPLRKAAVSTFRRS